MRSHFNVGCFLCENGCSCKVMYLQIVYRQSEIIVKNFTFQLFSMLCHSAGTIAYLVVYRFNISLLKMACGLARHIIIDQQLHMSIH